MNRNITEASTSAARCEEFTLTTSGGRELFARRWRADAKGVEAKGAEAKARSSKPTAVRGVVGVVHGLGDHSGRYQDLASRLAADGYLVLAFDQIGHGKSPGKRGWIANYNDVLNDIGSLLARMDEESPPPAPRFLLGQSFGGGAVLNYLLRRQTPLTGVIAASPLIRLASPPSRLREAALRAAARFAPRFAINAHLELEYLSDDPEVRKRFQQDPLVFGEVTLGMAVRMVDAGRWAEKHAARLITPTLMLHAPNDEITSHGATERFAESSEAATFISFQGRHELLQGDKLDETAPAILNWMRRQTEEIAEPPR